MDTKKNSRNEIKYQRKHQRQDNPYPVVEYVLNPDTTHETFVGFILNVSGSGLCLYTSKLLNVEQEIIIKSNFPVSFKTATVRWIEKYDEVFYRVGLEFV